MSDRVAGALVRNSRGRNRRNKSSTMVVSLAPATTECHPVVKYSMLTLFLFSSLVERTSARSVSNVVIGVDGGTESIRACCFDGLTGRLVGESCAVPYSTRHPQPGWAEQDPAEWYSNLGQAVRGAVASIPVECDHIITAISVDTTCCSVVALDDHNEPLRPCILWMDQRSASQAAKIMSQCKGDPALDVNCGGEGPISAEWMTPKALWIYENEREIWDAAKTICEYQDFINYKLTGTICASSCNAASRWHWDGDTCVKESGSYPGRPLSLYEQLGIPELADKLPSKCIPMAAKVGELTPEAAAHLGLSAGLPVIQGGPDAFVGMIGLGCINPGQLCLITGSSHLHCVVSQKPTTSAGTWGAYRGAPLQGINFAEGGQSSTGSIIRWARSIFGADLSYKLLDSEAAAIAPGADGLIALETFQGSRTPVTDPLARGALLGLTLSHTRAHIWRALMEAVCFGTRACVEGLARAGHTCSEIVIAGGATRSDLWLQMHSDVTGRPVVVCENADAPLLGCAILASVGIGLHDTVGDAVNAMVRTAKRVEPSPQAATTYADLYDKVYSKVADSVRPIAHAMHHLRGGAMRRSEGHDRITIISPSLLACDWSDVRGEVRRCLEAGANRLHVDIFDGVGIDSPFAFTFGPQMVEAIRRSCTKVGDMGHGATLDLHMCVERPARFVQPMAEVGADRFIFQWEAMGGLDGATALARSVVGSGMKCGVSINPTTDIEDIFPLLLTGLVDVVDLLAVEPGFGGQVFQRRVLAKVTTLDEWRIKASLNFDIMVDGGVNDETAAEIVAAGANVLVSGSFLFRHRGGMREGLDTLLKGP